MGGGPRFRERSGGFAIKGKQEQPKWALDHVRPNVRGGKAWMWEKKGLSLFLERDARETYPCTSEKKEVRKKQTLLRISTCQLRD